MKQNAKTGFYHFRFFFTLFSFIRVFPSKINIFSSILLVFILILLIGVFFSSLLYLYLGWFFRFSDFFHFFSFEFYFHFSKYFYSKYFICFLLFCWLWNSCLVGASPLHSILLLFCTLRQFNTPWNEVFIWCFSNWLII